MITLIVAHDRNMAIGRNGTIPWSAPEDLAAFKRETVGGALIMGRRTWESLPRRPLPQRMNIVVSSGDVGENPDAVVQAPEDAVRAAMEKGFHRIYGIGGAGIYRALLPVTDRLLVTEVDLEVEDADTHFPAFASSEWTTVAMTDLRDEAPACRLTEYLRR